jgi:hypothetical protein
MFLLSHLLTPAFPDRPHPMRFGTSFPEESSRIQLTDLRKRKVGEVREEEDFKSEGWFS